MKTKDKFLTLSMNTIPSLSELSAKVYAQTYRKKRTYIELYLPYCIQRGTPYGKSGKFILLNRYYKPLGIPNGEWVEYETFLWYQADLTKVDAIEWRGNRGWLYGATPARSNAHETKRYLKTLHILSQLIGAVEFFPYSEIRIAFPSLGDGEASC